MDLQTPKQVFSSGGHAKAWNDLVETQMWREAIHATLTQMALGATGGDPTFSTKIQGAKEFAVTLTNLAEPGTKKAPQTKRNLDHSV